MEVMTFLLCYCSLFLPYSLIDIDFKVWSSIYNSEYNYFAYVLEYLHHVLPLKIANTLRSKVIDVITYA